MLLGVLNARTSKLEDFESKEGSTSLKIGRILIAQ
jgi:hypothetical protein